MIALDASALLAFMYREAGHERVATVIEGSCLSTVNLSEVIGRFVRDGQDGFAVLRRLQTTSIEFVEFTISQAALAASLLPKTRPLGLSLGDRACLALALSRRIPAMTADAAWAGADFGIEVHMIR